MTPLLADLIARLAGPQNGTRSLEEGVALVERTLDAIGLDWELVDSEEGVLWAMQQGSAALFVSLHHNPVIDDDTLEVYSPILHLPLGTMLPFYRRCLELNRILVGCAIGVERDVVIVSAERPIWGLDERELRRMLLNVASAADHFDDELAAEFGAEKIGID